MNDIGKNKSWNLKVREHYLHGIVSKIPLEYWLPEVHPELQYNTDFILINGNLVISLTKERAKSIRNCTGCVVNCNFCRDKSIEFMEY